MIYGRFRNPVTLVRWAVLADVRRLEGRDPDRQDREAIKNDSYLVVREIDPKNKERLYHQAFLRADGGAAEIAEARDKLPHPGTAADITLKRKVLRQPTNLTGTQLAILRHVAAGDDPSTYEVGPMTLAPALAFNARERSLTSLLKRGLLMRDDEGGWHLTDAARQILGVTS